MAKYGSASIGLLVDGYNLLSAKVKELRYKIEMLQEPSHGLGDGWEETTPVGTRRASVIQNGAFFDTSAGGMHETMYTGRELLRIACMWFAGSAVARSFMGSQGVYSHTYEVLAELDKLQKANVIHQVSGILEEGTILHPLGAETGATGDTESTPADHNAEPNNQNIPITSSSVANPTVITTTVPHGLVTGDTVVIANHSGSTPSLNNEYTVTVTGTTTFTVPVNVTVGGTGGSLTRGKTQSGGNGYLQVTALTLGGYTNVVVKVRHSADDVTYADLLSFVAVTAVGAQKVAVAGTVNRYLAASHAFGGAGSGQSVTYFAGFARS